jgi:hypothetical protein
MRSMKVPSLVRVAALAALILSPIAAAAQSSTLATSEVAGFIGTWAITVESPQGALEQTLVLKDADGKVAAELSNQLAPGVQPITDIAKAGNDLVLKFTAEFSGMTFDAKITLVPDGVSKAKVSFDVMDGQFVMDGTGVKK